MIESHDSPHGDRQDSRAPAPLGQKKFSSPAAVARSGLSLTRTTRGGATRRSGGSAETASSPGSRQASERAGKQVSKQTYNQPGWLASTGDVAGEPLIKRHPGSRRCTNHVRTSTRSHTRTRDTKPPGLYFGRINTTPHTLLCAHRCIYTYTLTRIQTRTDNHVKS